MSHSLLIVAVRTDRPPEIRRRIETILAASAPFDAPPDTQAVVWAKAAEELTAEDLQRLAEIVGWDHVRALNVGEVAAERD